MFGNRDTKRKNTFKAVSDASIVAKNVVSNIVDPFDDFRAAARRKPPKS